LKESATTEESSVVQKEGNRQPHRDVRMYNLNAILYLGDNGYTINEKRLDGTRWTEEQIRNLTYVAIKRARERLYILYSSNHSIIE